MSAPRADGVRLPAHYEPSTIDFERHAPWIIATVLESGDTSDLRWLLQRYGGERLRRWLGERGPRQLSRRSLAFWRLMLGGEGAAERPGTELWQL